MSAKNPPKTYKCSKCHVTGKKLWRNYQSCNVDLVCYNCSGETNVIDDNGKVAGWATGVKTDQIYGSRVPAVPVFESELEAYWGYTCVPNDEVEWWRKLPSQ